MLYILQWLQSICIAMDSMLELSTHRDYLCRPNTEFFGSLSVPAQFIALIGLVVRKKWTAVHASAGTRLTTLVCYKSDITQNALFNLFFRRSFWKFNFLAITEEREIYLIISISKQCMESCKFPSAYTIISGLLDDVNKQ